MNVGIHNTCNLSNKIRYKIIIKKYLNMEDLVFVILCLISINNLKFKGINLYFTDYMDAKNTSQIKGIFVWIILLSHYKGYFKRNKKYIYIYILNCIGTQKVSMFLFYSGFGIYESIKIVFYLCQNFT